MFILENLQPWLSAHSWAVVLGGLVLCGGAIIYGPKAWALYVERRETFYQPHILMAIADEDDGRLGEPFKSGRRIGDWRIVENILFEWSTDLSGFARKGFERIFAKNGFGEYERDRLGGVFARTRVDAAWRLGRMVYVKAAPDLLPLLKDRSSEVRRMASWALAKLGQSEVSIGRATSPLPEAVAETAGKSSGTISGHFLWEDGAHIVIGDEEETNYLVHRKGGMHGDVKNMPIVTPGGRKVEGGRWRTYGTQFRLLNIDPTYTATVKAVFKQSIDDYYAVVHRQRGGIRTSAGCETSSVDFAFPRFKSPEDRLSVTGVLLLARGNPSGITGREKAVVSLRKMEDAFYAGYLSFYRLGEYRLHDVPPGRYRIRAVVGPFMYEGFVEIPETQPFKLDLTLSASARA